MVDKSLEAQRLATRLRRARLERGLSMRGAAAATGIARDTLTDLERARRQPYPTTLRKIAEGYNVEIKDLLGPMVEEEATAPLADASPAGASVSTNIAVGDTGLAGLEEFKKSSARAIEILATQIPNPRKLQEAPRRLTEEERYAFVCLKEELKRHEDAIESIKEQTDHVLGEFQE